MTPNTKAVDRPVARYSRIRITVTRGPDAGVSHDAISNTIRIGTSTDNDLVLTDPTVSRRHCSVEPLANSARVRDEGSTNGVVLLGTRLYDAVVTRTLELEVGDTIIALEFLNETVEREQASDFRFGRLLGRSPRMRELFADLARIARTDVTLLIEGETGTGKELVAESVHAASARAEGPLVVFDCSAVADNLIESELFGHEKGAFTGAIASRPGVFEQADGGTLFFDELAELKKDLQPKLLRALERREVRRLGSQRTIAVNVRVVAATNKNLLAEVRHGNFREDLYFRLAGAHVYVPPLRDRMDDLPLLVEHFLNRAKSGVQLADIPEQVWEMFNAHRWPGNVRELSNAVQRFLVTPDRVLAGPSDPSAPEAGPSPVARPEPPLDFQELREARREAGESVERAYLYALLARADGNITRAASVAGVSRQMLQKLIRKYDVA